MNDNQEFVLPLSNKNLLPKNNLDKGLFILMTIGIPSLSIWELIILFRYYPELNSICICHIIIQSILIINILTNLFYLQRADSSGKRKKMPHILHANWKYCHFCQINSPPRSYHCPVCDECILKRDQHCMFAGCCVGFYNHRYYLLAVSYIMLGSLYYLILQWPHVFETIGGYHWLSLVCMLAPHIAVLFGLLSIYGFICAVSQIVLACVLLLTTYLFGVQIMCISQGQTIHEKKAGITLYDLGWKKNFTQVLGKKWYFAIIFPFTSSPIDGDGINFLTFYDLNEIKNV